MSCRRNPIRAFRIGSREEIKEAADAAMERIFRSTDGE